MNFSDYLAIIQYRALTACGEPFSVDAIPNIAFGAMPDFNSLHPATGAVNHFGIDVRSVVQCSPLFSSLAAQSIIVIQSSDIGIARSAI